MHCRKVGYMYAQHIQSHGTHARTYILGATSSDPSGLNARRRKNVEIVSS